MLDQTIFLCLEFIYILFALLFCGKRVFLDVLRHLMMFVHAHSRPAGAAKTLCLRFGYVDMPVHMGANEPHCVCAKTLSPACDDTGGETAMLSGSDPR